MTISLRRALFALALGCAFSPTSLLWIAPAKAQIATETIELSAIVRAPDGTAIKGADVTVIARDENGKPRYTELKTNEQGRFATQQSKTKWGSEAFVHAPGYAFGHIYVLPDKTGNLTLKLGATAMGKVVNSTGESVANALIKVKSLSFVDENEPDARLRSASIYQLPENSAIKRALQLQTDENGNWQLDDLPDGANIVFQLLDSRFARFSVGLVLESNLQKVPDLVATPGATLKGRVLNPDGKPLADARVDANVGSGRNGYGSTQTDADGTFTIASLLTGDAEIKVGSPVADLAPTSVQGVTVTAGQITTAPDIKLDAGVLLTGKVTDKETKMPLAEASVMAQGDFGNVPSTLTGKDGIYRVRVPQGQVRFYVYARPAGYISDIFADTKANIGEASTNAPDFAIQRGLTLTGTAVDETGTPAQGATIIAGSAWEGAQSGVDAQGKWTLTGVNANSNGRRDNGEGQLKTTGNWQIVGDGMVSLRAGDEIKLILRRIERQDVTLRIVTPEGEPVEGAQVRFAILVDATNRSTRYETAVSNAAGEVTVRKLRPDESAEVTATKENYALQKSGVITALKANEARATDAILTPKNGTLRGRIVNAAGEAVRGASVAVLWPGDVRQPNAIVRSDENGRFAMENLRTGELLIGAAQGRDWGQTEAQTGGDIEIKLAPAAPQPAPENRELARALLQGWFEDEGQRSNSNLAEYAARVASLDADSAAQLAQFAGAGNQSWFDTELAQILAKKEPQRAIETARAEAEQPKKADEHQQDLLDLTTLLVRNGEAEEARAAYEKAAPVAIAASKTGAANPGSVYRYAQLAGITGALQHRDASYWAEILDRALPDKPNDEMMFRIGGYMKTFAESDVDSALAFMETLTPAAQVRAYEDVIPVVVARDLPRAQEILARMDAMVARGDLPIEPDRNDAMYRPKPARSLNVARASIVKALLPTDPRAAYEQAKKITADGYDLERLQIVAALRLPDKEALPILRAQFTELRDKGDRSGGDMARLARLVEPLDSALSEQWFETARARLADDKYNDETMRESAAPYAFYRAASNPAQSRLMLENEWQRWNNIKTEEAYHKSSLLQNICWAMVPIDLERALQMMRETDTIMGKENYNKVWTQRNYLMWILASERERREIDFERPESSVFGSG